MIRRVFPCLALSVFLLAPACKKKEGEGEDAARAAKIAASESTPTNEPPAQPPATPTKEEPPVTPPPADPDASKADSSGAGGSGGAAGSGGGAPAPREDLTCDPSVKGECLEGEQCIGAQGCDAVWTCDAQIVCKKGVREYCGCDGRTFEAVFGNCPWKKYEYAGPCK